VRGIAGAVERSWSGEQGAVAWTKLLLPLAFGYAVASGAARRRAAAVRPALEGCYVLAVGNLTVGGAGKSSIARWLVLQAVGAGSCAAVLLRGHGASAPGDERGVVPDFAEYPLQRRVARYGDEAIAHRIALPREASVAVDPDRWRAARAVRAGYGARTLVLDDGWEQSGIRWNELWVALDPRLPVGNGSLLPAGPLRRPAPTLREASRVVFLLEEPGETVPEGTLAWVARTAPGVPVLRFRRTLESTTPVGEPENREPLPGGARIGLVSGIGAPSRLERFVRGAGFELCHHEVFADHARWSPALLERAIARARLEGAETVLITEKDEPRWPSGLRAGLPVRVIRAGLTPLDPVEEALRPLRAAAAAEGRARAS
jgi:tetraacyldisaccharide 4'-kinase